VLFCPPFIYALVFAHQLDLHDTYLPAFRACVEQTDVQQVMCSYNAVNGIPTCLSGAVQVKPRWITFSCSLRHRFVCTTFPVHDPPTTQNGLLRSAWKFNGNIVSDCDAVADAYQPHNFTSTVCLLSQSLHLIQPRQTCLAFFPG
jgi:beta-glucosidase-like glycosyl hydrolase